MFDRFTGRARQVVVLAQEEARMLNHDYIGTEHILLALLHPGTGIAGKALESLGITLAAARQQVEQIAGRGQPGAQPGRIPFTPRAKKTLELSLGEAIQLGHYIGTEHVLLGLVRAGEDPAVQALSDLGADPARVRQEVFRLLQGYQGEDESVTLHTSAGRGKDKNAPSVVTWAEYSLEGSGTIRDYWATRAPRTF
jgi:ATP-dependent Clp protease ATP-binding subunit ClpC